MHFCLYIIHALLRFVKYVIIATCYSYNGHTMLMYVCLHVTPTMALLCLCKYVNMLLLQWPYYADVSMFTCYSYNGPTMFM